MSASSSGSHSSGPSSTTSGGLFSLASVGSSSSVPVTGVTSSATTTSASLPASSTAGLFSAPGSGGLFTAASSGTLFDAPGTGRLFAAASTTGLFGTPGTGGPFALGSTERGTAGPLAVASTGGLFDGLFPPASIGGVLAAPSTAVHVASQSMGGFFAGSSTPSTGGLFSAVSTGGFLATPLTVSGDNTPSIGGLFGSAPTAGVFAAPSAGGSTTTPSTGGLFGAASTGGFLAAPSTVSGYATPSAGGLFGSAPTGGVFTAPLAGISTTTPSTGGLFGAASTGGSLAAPSSVSGYATPSTGGLFGSAPTGGVFAAPLAGGSTTTPSTGGLFGAASTGGFLAAPSSVSGYATPSTGGLFGSAGGVFAAPIAGGSTTTPSTGGLFGAASTGGFLAAPSTVSGNATPSTGGLFGSQIGSSCSGSSSEHSPFCLGTGITEHSLEEMRWKLMRAAVLISHEFWASEQGQCHFFCDSRGALVYEELVGDGTQKVTGFLKETPQKDIQFARASKDLESDATDAKPVTKWHANLTLVTADACPEWLKSWESSWDDIFCDAPSHASDHVGEIVVHCVEGPPPEIRTQIKLVEEAEWDPPVVCRPVPDESFFKALADGDYEAIVETVGSGVHLTAQQRTRIDKLKGLSEAVNSDDTAKIDKLLHEGLTLSDATRQRVEQQRERIKDVQFKKALAEDDLEKIDQLLETGIKASEEQQERIIALREDFAGKIPSLYVLHQRFLALVSKRRHEYQAPVEYSDLIASLKACLQEGSLLQALGVLSAASLEKAITAVKEDVKYSQDQLLRAQIEIRKAPHDNDKQVARDKCREHHAAILLAACAKLLRCINVIAEDDDLDEPAFASEVITSRMKVQKRIQSLRSAAVPLLESLRRFGQVEDQAQQVDDEQAAITAALQSYDAWVWHCTGTDVVVATDQAAEEARIALVQTALRVTCGPDESSQLAESLKALGSAITKEEALWGSNVFDSFPCGPAILAAGRTKRKGIEQYMDALQAIDAALETYAVDLSEAEQGLDPEEYRNNHVKDFESALLRKLEAHERHEDALLVLQRAQRRKQENEHMRICVDDASALLRTADAELKEATAAIASVSHIFPEVNVHFKEGLPLDLVPLWVPDRTLSVFSQQELLPVSSRNRVYKVIVENHAYAIKEFAVTPASLSRCYHEAAILRRMRHPHVVELIAIFEDPNSSALYLQFPFYEHGQLDAWVQREHPGLVPLRRAIWQIVQALKHLHAHGIVHSDVKPANILIDHRASAHLADFDVSIDAAVRTSVARATQIGFSAGFAAPELAASGASSASDMFALGEVINLVAEKSAEREELVSQVKAGDPCTRPSAAALLQHQYFSPVADWCRDSVRQCCVMASKRCEFGAADCRLSQGIECASGHFVCLDCLDAHVQHVVGQHGSQHRMQEGRVHCPKYPSECRCAYDDAELASRIERATFNSYLTARVSLLEKRKAQELEEEMKVRLASELQNLASLDESQRKVQQAQNHIIEEILTLRCPSCSQAFIDFDGCFALKCSRCSRGFCAWCGSTSQGDVHDHVRQCTHKPPGADIFFGTPEQFKQANIKRQRRLLKKYLSTLEEDISNIVLVELKHELKDLSDDYSPPKPDRAERRTPRPDS